MNFTFKSKDGFCPTCEAFGRIWYIQDREIGTNCYEYALFSKSADKPKEYQFKQRRDVAMFLNDCKNDNAIYDAITTEYIISRQTVVECWDSAIIEKKGSLYRFNKNKNTLTEISKSKQETGFMSYLACLNMAKDILQKTNVKQQMTLEDWMSEVNT